MKYKLFILGFLLLFGTIALAEDNTTNSTNNTIFINGSTNATCTFNMTDNTTVCNYGTVIQTEINATKLVMLTDKITSLNDSLNFCHQQQNESSVQIRGLIENSNNFVGCQQNLTIASLNLSQLNSTYLKLNGDYFTLQQTAINNSNLAGFGGFLVGAILVYIVIKKPYLRRTEHEVPLGVGPEVNEAEMEKESKLLKKFDEVEERLRKEFTKQPKKRRR